MKSEAAPQIKSLSSCATLEGAVYPTFNLLVHVVRAFTPAREWPRYVSIDFGTRNPAAWL